MPETLTADNLNNLPNIRHGFFTRGWGNCGISQDQAAGMANRIPVATALGVEADHLLTCDQQHTPHVVAVTNLWPPDQRPVADAMVTKTKGIALGVLTADCVPVLFADAKASIIGACHAGWRGALSDVMENTLKAMEALGATRRGIEAAIGPCIWQNSYEVGPEFPAPFLAESDDNRRFFRPALRADHYMFNLPGYAENKLRAAKIGLIGPSIADTCADPQRFFSFRRDTLNKAPRSGNLMSAIVLAN